MVWYYCCVWTKFNLDFVINDEELIIYLRRTRWNRSQWINKGTLAENMGGNVSTARVLALRPLKTPGIYRTWQEERKNYSGENWWKAQEINIITPLSSKVYSALSAGVATYKVIKNPYISVGVSVASTVLVNDSTAEIEKNLKNEHLKTGEQKEKEAGKR